MAGFGIPAADIGASIGISEPTLRKYYADELRLGHVKANAAVAQSLFKKATGDGSQAVTAAIFWAKTRMGWKETIVHVGDDNAPDIGMRFTWISSSHTSREGNSSATTTEPNAGPAS